MTAADLLKRCREAGLTLQREGDGLAVLGPEHLLSPSPH